MQFGKGLLSRHPSSDLSRWRTDLADIKQPTSDRFRSLPTILSWVHSLLYSMSSSAVLHLQWGSSRRCILSPGSVYLPFQLAFWKLSRLFLRNVSVTGVQCVAACSGALENRVFWKQFFLFLFRRGFHPFFQPEAPSVAALCEKPSALAGIWRSEVASFLRISALPKEAGKETVETS